VQFKDHDNFPKSDQRRTPGSRKGDIIAHQHRLLARILTLTPSAHLGNFQPAQVGIIRPALTIADAKVLPICLDWSGTHHPELGKFVALERLAGEEVAA
jgi:hypothetical protein